MRFRVEPMRIEHIPVVAEIERRSFTQPWPSNAYRKEIQTNRTAHYFVARRVDDELDEQPSPEPGQTVSDGRAPHAGAEENGSDHGILGKLSRLFRGPAEGSPPLEAELLSIAGFAGLWLMTDEAHITTIAVDPIYRGRGIGELLLLGLIDRAKQIGARWLTLEVRMSNRVAQRLYQKYTFKEMGIRRRYYSDNGEDAQVMWTDPIDSERFREALRQHREVLARKLGHHD